MTDDLTHGGGGESDASGDDEFVEMDLACPACNADLLDDDLFTTHRVCRACRRHFWLTARERVGLIVDPATFVESNAELVSVNPLIFHDRLPVADRLAEAREQSGIVDAVVTGAAAIGGEQAVVVALDLAAIGGGLGVLSGEKIALAIEAAISRRLPLVALCSGGDSRAADGVLSLVQLARLSGLVARLRRVGLPFISLLTHPTTGNVFLGFAAQADLVFAEPAAHVGLSSVQTTLDGFSTSESMLATGAIDGVIDRTELRDHLATLLDLLGRRSIAHPPAQAAAASPSGGLRSWEERELARDERRPTAHDYLERLAQQHIPLHGDRISADSAVVSGAIGRLDGTTAMLIAIGRDGDAFDAASVRKATRLLRLAARLELPTVVLTDARAGSGNPGDGGVASARHLAARTASTSAIVTVLLGHVEGAQAYTWTIGDRVLMLEHAVLSASGSKSVATARDCLRLGIVDAIVAEPAGGAQEDPEQMAMALRHALSLALGELGGSQRRLLDERARRFRQLGMSTAESREAAGAEIREFQELQRAVGRSLEELRHRWDGRRLTLPHKPSMPHLPHRSDFPAIALPKIDVRRAGLAGFVQRVAVARRPAAPELDPDEIASQGEGMD